MKTLTKTSSLAVIAFLFLGAVSAADGASSSLQESSQWKRYIVRDEEFSILLPELPAMMTSIWYFEGNRRRRVRTLGAYAKGVVYSVFCYQNRNNESLDNLVQQFTQSTAERDSSIRNLTSRGFDGREVAYKTENSASVKQYWLTKKSLYVFAAFSRGDSSSFQGFFDSLILGPDSSGDEVMNGNGAAANDSADVENSEVFVGKQVDKKAILGSKPEPSYTEEARQKQVQGTVVLKAVFGATGRVSNIRVVVGLPNGLTENAIEAARQIRFVPAQKDGKNVSMWFQLEYNFNLF